MGNESRYGRLKRANEKLKLLSEVVDRLLMYHSPREVIRELYDPLSDHLGIEVYFHYLVNEEDAALYLDSYAGVSEEVAKEMGRFSLGVGVCGQAALDRTRIVAEEIQQSSDLKTEIVRSFGIQAYACYPLVAHDRLIGTFSFGTRRRARFETDELDLMQTISNQVAVAIERAWLISELEEKNARLDLAHSTLRTLFDTLPAAIIVAEASSGRKTFWNKKAEESIGVPIDEDTADPNRGYRLLRPDGEPIPKEALPLPRALKGEVVENAEIRVRTERGREMTILASAAPVCDQGGKITSAIAAFQDITERKRTEEALREANQTLTALIQASPLAIIALDIHANVKIWNPAAERIFGWTEEEVLGCPLPIVPESKKDEAHALREGVLHGKGFMGVETHRQKKDGSPIDASISTAPLRDATGNINGIMAVIADVTLRKRTEEERADLLERTQAAHAEAEQAQKRLAFLADASSVLTASLDYQTTLEWVARLAVPFLADGCVVDILEGDGSIRRVAVAATDPSKEKLGHELMRRYPPDPEGQHPLQRVLRTGKPEIFKVTDALLSSLARGDAHLKIARMLGLKSAMIIPLLAHGRTLGAISFVSAESGRHYGPADLSLAEDLARRAAVAVDNARLYRKAQEANRAKDEFLAILSHELRTPLNAMLGWSRLLQEGRLDEETKGRALDSIERNTQAQVQLIEDLLDVSRIITGKFRLDARPVEVAPVIEAALDAVRPAAEAKGIRLQRLSDPATGPVFGDPDRLKQIVWNLLSNAVKFTPPGGDIRVQTARAGAHIEIRVTDTGKGINADFLPHVFDRFSQADSTSTRVHGGLGLGLAIVRHLVELQGGAVQAESPGEGRGATFRVILPVMNASKEEGAPGQGNPEAEDRRPANRRSLLEGLHVLGVDDDADARELMTIMLRHRGARVTVVASAAEALEALERLKPDILVADIGMPGEDGYTLIRKVRALDAERGGKIPAAALTAYASKESVARSLEAGFQVHVAKPVEPDQLVSVVAKLAGRVGEV